MKRRLILAGMLILAIAAFLWLSTHSFIEILPEGSSKNISYNMTNVGSHKTLSFKSSQGTKKLVRKGQYQIQAREGETSYLVAVDAGGFLGTTSTTIKLVPEKGRKFVGDNPASCMYYIGQVLASVECGDLYSQLQVHVPATQKQPTITSKTTSPIDGIIEGMASTAGGTIVLLNSPSGHGHTAYIVHADLSLDSPVMMKSLNAHKPYTMQGFKEGFVIYDSSYSQILYYSSLNSNPSTITIKKSGNQKLVPYSLKIQEGSILVAYSDNATDAAAGRGDDDRQASKPTNKAAVSILVYKDNQSHEYNFKHRISAFALCGTRKLCLLDTINQLEVYDIAGDKPHKLFSLSGVERLEPTQNGELLVTNKDGLVSLDVDNRHGFLQYSLGEYRLCGLRADNKAAATLCIRDTTNRTMALKLDPATNNADSIDKKVAKLRLAADVKTLSIYDKLIYISPNVGDVVYIPSLKVFGHDPAKIKAVSATVRQSANSVGIDTNIYKIITPFDN